MRAAPLAGLVLYGAGLCLGPLRETDVFFRLARGDQILRTGAVPLTNLFSFTAPDHAYLDGAWLFDLGAALLHRAGGFPALVVAKTACVLVALAVFYWAARRRGAGRLSAALCLAIAAAVSTERFVERPHVVSFLGEAAVAAWLATAAAGAGARKLWWLVPAVALWANLHAGAFVAPLLIGLGAGGVALDRRRDASTVAAPTDEPIPGRAGPSDGPSDSARPASAAHLAGLALATLAALVVTPVGSGIFRYLGAHAGMFALHPVDEFRPPSFASDALLLAAAAGAAVLVLWPRGARRPLWRDLLPLAGLAALALDAVRFAPDFVLFAATLAAPRLTALAASRPALARIAAARARALHAALGAGLLVLAALPRVTDARDGTPIFDLDLDPTIVPGSAIAFVAAHDLGRRMYNDFEVGGYLAWRGYPRHRVFVDARLPAYPRELHRLLGRADLGRAEWDAALATLGVDSALLAYAGVNRRVSWWDPDRWALVFRQDDARVYLRRLPRWRAFIAAHEIPATFRWSDQAGNETLPLPAPPSASPVPDCEWRRRLGDLFFDLDRGRPDRALPAYRQALAAPPGCLDPERAAATLGWVRWAETAPRR